MTDKNDYSLLLNSFKNSAFPKGSEAGTQTRTCECMFTAALFTELKGGNGPG